MNTLTTDYMKMPGHWVLASLGKKVLRPGGIGLTRKMLEHLNIRSMDQVIEFAPGLGITARMTLSRSPQSYIAIEQNEQAAQTVQSYLSGDNRSVIIGNVEHVPLPNRSATVIYGEAMLTMQAPVQKERIIQEAARLLKPGGRYGIHEMSLAPDKIDLTLRKQVCKDLAQAIRVNVAPLTALEWMQLLENNGFRVLSVHTAPMHLLHFGRLIQDEGWRGVAKMAGNLLKNRPAMRRVLQMRRQFVKHASQLQAISIVAEYAPEING